MAIKPVLRYGDPKLLKKSRPIKQFDTPELHSLIQDMKDTMHSLNGAGLAAPQIGVNLQLVIFGSQDNPRYPDADAVPFTILINPKLTFVNDTQEEGWEGCLS
ncbi:MAG: peptide deformylase, partial [Betaproteobacteria bacterium]